MKVNDMCCLCLKETNNGNLIWKDSMQLCEDCYNEYNKNNYTKECMIINAIKKYRNALRNFEEANK